MAENNVSNDVSQDMSQKTSDLAKAGLNKAGRGVNKATRKAQKAAKNAVKKVMKKATKQAIKLAVKAIAQILKIIIQILMAIWPYALGVLAIWLAVWIIGSYFTDDEYESKAEEDNYQTEQASEDNTIKLDPETGKYEILNHSNGNKLYKMFYGYMAQKGYWKVVVDKNGKPTTDLMRGDDKNAKKIVDLYNREKDFIMNSDLLYLLDIELNAGEGNDFFFPEQFIQPVYHDDKYNLKSLTNKDQEVVAKSTKYDKNGKPTDKKVPGVWDYGFGSILQYQKFEEDREKRANLTEKEEWDFKEHKMVTKKETDTDDTVKESVSGYPKDTYLITKVTNSIGTITNKVKVEWTKTSEPWTKTVEVNIPAEKQVTKYKDVQSTNKNGEKLFWKLNPKTTPTDMNTKTTKPTEWPVTHKESYKAWEKTTKKATKTYKGYVWEKVPQYDGEPNTDGIVGDKYMFDYLTNYESYVPNAVMENFDIKKRTGKDIDGLKEIFQEQEAVENADSDYDKAPDDSSGSGSLNLSGNVSGDSSKYQNASKFLDLYQTYGKRYGVDPYLLLAIAAQESGGNDGIDTSRYGSAGVGLMQIVASTGEGGVSATNLETGEKESFHLNDAGDFTAENSIRFTAMYLQGLIAGQHGNVIAAIRGYNSGGGAMLNAMKKYASDKGISLDEAYKKPSSEWLGYNKVGDTEYVSRVMSYYSSPDGGQPYIIDAKGTKYSADGSVQAGAAVVGDGTSSNQSWFSSLISAIADHWSDLFNDSPTDAFENKDKYTWHLHKNRMTENEYKDFMKLYRTFVEDKPFSEIKDEWTLDDWKSKYKALFENPTVEGTVSQQTLDEYSALLKLFPDGFDLPAAKISKISDPFDGSIIKLSVGKNATIKAMAAGKVTDVDKEDGVVEITHDNGVKTRYTGLQGISVKKGDSVKKGQAIAKSNKDLGIGITDNKGNSVDPSPIFVVMGDGSQSYNYQAVLQEIEKYKGYPYVFGGSSPDTSFDCSGLMQWAFKKAGINLPRTAQEQYDKVLHISETEARPGDLVFFQHTYNAGRPITHVGLYIGNGQFWNANDSGVEISNLSAWRKYDPVFGRVTN